MEHIKLLIVDDVEDNRLVLRAICRKMEGFEIHEAIDGQDAVEKCRELRPHIILMDVMMPRLDGFQATKIIKKEFPETIVMAVTAVIDPKMEENMASIGVAAYIRKPIDKELIRLKLQSYAGSLSIKGREKNLLAKRSVLNPFTDQVRSFKTVFEIQSNEAIMDFGIWLLGRFECAPSGTCTKVDTILELLYELVRNELKAGGSATFTIEESFDEMFIHIPLCSPLQPDRKITYFTDDLGAMCLVREDSIAVRIPLYGSRKQEKPNQSIEAEKSIEMPARRNPDLEASPILSTPTAAAETVEAEKREIGGKERQVLRESFVYKTSAKEYIETIDSDAFGEVSDLREAEEAWEGWLDDLAQDPTAEKLCRFADEVLGVYASTISALQEFSGLSYAMVSLSSLVKFSAESLAEDTEKLNHMLLFLRYFKNDLSSWIEHVFELQDTQDIHYLDGSFFSSCMQIETIISGAEFDNGEEGEIEFF